MSKFRATKQIKGKRHVAWGRSPVEAQEKLEKQIALYYAPTLDASQEVRTVVELAETLWFSTLIHHKNTTRRNQTGDFKRYIAPTIGQLNYKEVRKIDVQTWYDQLCKSKSGATANKALSILRSVFREAIHNMVLDANPCTYVKTVKKSEPRDYYMSAEDVNSMILGLVRGGFKNLVPVAILGGCLGLRRGEFFEIKWSDVDFDHGFLVVSRSRDKFGVVSDTKSHRARGINLPESWAWALKEYGDIDRQYICTNGGIPWTATTLDRHVRKAQKAGLWRSDFKLHGLRHIANNNLAIVNELGARKVLGHRHASTNDRYISKDVANTVEVTEAVANKITLGNT